MLIEHAAVLAVLAGTAVLSAGLSLCSLTVVSWMVARRAGRPDAAGRWLAAVRPVPVATGAILLLLLFMAVNGRADLDPFLVRVVGVSVVGSTAGVQAALGLVAWRLRRRARRQEARESSAHPDRSVSR